MVESQYMRAVGIINRLEILENLFNAIESKHDHLYDGLEKLFDKIEKIETNSGRHVCLSQSDEIGKIKKELLETRIQFIDQLGNDRKPYKCPICEGKGNNKSEVEPKVLKFEFCASCEGKGIVWG